ncbi:MAG: gliding motility lipoprotein GldH [Prevotellaceae bacterium]|jgi:gliding motility-associated lipoprotein GldH|nr:gliding motility lipoprotein GldH [Prevotellaceae bacterium]
MKTRLKNSILAAVVAFVALSCEYNGIAEQQANIPQTQWHKDSIIPLLLPVDDTFSTCAVLLTLRCTDDYPYNNIILSVTTTAPSGISVCDTVEYRLMGDKGWYGKIGGTWIDSRLEFRTGVRFPQHGAYRFDIAHLMRHEKLPGVGAIGVRIERMEEAPGTGQPQ